MHVKCHKRAIQNGIDSKFYLHKIKHIKENSKKLENTNIDSVWVVEFKSEFYFFPCIF